MRLHALSLVLAAAAVVGTPAAHAQIIPDTTAPWTYYPLAVGDEWQYEVVRNYYQYCPPCRYELSAEVVGLETHDARQYAAVRWRSHNVPGMPNPPLPERTERVRYDTLAATPVRLTGTGGELPVDADGCRLDEPFPAHPDSTRAISCPGEWDWATVQGGYDQPLPLGGLAAVKAFTRVWFTYLATTTFAAGIGVLSRYTAYEIEIDERHTLAYARVAGVEYGTPIVAAEPPPPAGRPALTVSPNPADGMAAARFHTAAAGRARVTLHDLLGREVLVAHDGWLPAGTHDVTMGAAGLPAGAYVVRAATMERSASVLLVIR